MTQMIMMKNVWKSNVIGMMKLDNMIVDVRSVFHEGNKYY